MAKKTKSAFFKSTYYFNAFLAYLLIAQSSAASLLSNPEISVQMIRSGLGSMHFWTKENFAVYNDTGISLFYGVNSLYSYMQPESKKEHLQRKKKAGAFPENPEPTACVFWVFRHLQRAYEGAGLSERWKEIETFVRSKDSDGIFLLQEMQKDGWEAVYWNFDVKHPLDKAEHHSYYASQVEKTGIYQGIKIQHKLVNFRPNPQGNTVVDNSSLEKLARVPFWVGIANGAFHVFLGYGDRINEAHSTYNPDEIKNIQDRPFSEFGLDTPVKYLSGVILVPPGYWK